jgi:hypothetical protein
MGILPDVEEDTIADGELPAVDIASKKRSCDDLSNEGNVAVKKSKA